jgi:hypothetical protein
MQITYKVESTQDQFETGLLDVDPAYECNLSIWVGKQMWSLYPELIDYTWEIVQ